MTNQERLAQKFAKAQATVQQLEKKLKAEERAKQKKAVEIIKATESALGSSLIKAIRTKPLTIDFVYFVDQILTDLEISESKRAKEHQRRYLVQEEVKNQYQQIKSDWEARILEQNRVNE